MADLGAHNCRDVRKTTVFLTLPSMRSSGFVLTELCEKRVGNQALRKRFVLNLCGSFVVSDGGC